MLSRPPRNEPMCRNSTSTVGRARWFRSSAANCDPNRPLWSRKSASTASEAVSQLARAVITRRGAFSLQFRSRSGCVFVARWRSGLTIGACVSLARAPHQKKTQQLYLTATRLDAEGFCAFSMFMIIGEHVQGVLWTPSLLHNSATFCFCSTGLFVFSGVMYSYLASCSEQRAVCSAVRAILQDSPSSARDAASPEIPRDDCTYERIRYNVLRIISCVLRNFYNVTSLIQNA